MKGDEQEKRDVEQFLQDKIDTVPHLEALLLLWNSRPKPWSVVEMADGLFVAPEAAKRILEDLVRQRVILACSAPDQAFYYDSNPDQDQLIAAVDLTYRRELIRVSRLIHAKPSAALREFARAFRLKPERD